MRTLEFCGTPLLSIAISVDMSPLTANDAVENILMRSTSPCLASAEECGTLKDLSSDSATLLTPAIKRGAEATNATAAPHDEIEEVVAATPPLRRQA